MFRSSVIRTVLPLLIAAGVVVFFGLPYFDRLLQSWFAADLQLRSHLVMNSMEERLPTLLARDDPQALGQVLNRVALDQRVLAILICRPDGELLFKTHDAPAALSCADAAAIPDGHSSVLHTPSGSIQSSVFDQHPQGVQP